MHSDHKCWELITDIAEDSVEQVAGLLLPRQYIRMENMRVRLARLVLINKEMNMRQTLKLRFKVRYRKWLMQP